MSTPGLINASEAARILGIKKTSLYAYVSRGILKSYDKPGVKSRHYSRAEVERLRVRSNVRTGQAPVAANALRWGEPVLDSTITRIDEKGPYYRGYSAVELAQQHQPFENVAELLWTGLLPESPVLWEFEEHSSMLLDTKPNLSIAAHQLAIRLFNLIVAEYAIYETQQRDQKRSNDTDRCQRIIGRYVNQLHCLKPGSWQDQFVGEWGLAEAICRIFLSKPTVETIQLVNQALILSADHELTPSTFGARIAASTGADLTSCLSAATGALAGPLHGGTFATLDRLLASCKSNGVRKTLKNIKDTNQKIVGFDHNLYRSTDPRANHLLEQLEANPDKSIRTQLIREVIYEADRHGFGKPSIDIVLLMLVAHCKLPAALATAIFTIGRSAGWTAHVLEQRLSGFMVRPRARYTGR